MANESNVYGENSLDMSENELNDRLTQFKTKLEVLEDSLKKLKTIVMI